MQRGYHIVYVQPNCPWCTVFRKLVGTYARIDPSADVANTWRQEVDDGTRLLPPDVLTVPSLRLPSGHMLKPDDVFDYMLDIIVQAFDRQTRGAPASQPSFLPQSAPAPAAAPSRSLHEQLADLGKSYGNSKSDASSTDSRQSGTSSQYHPRTDMLMNTLSAQVKSTDLLSRLSQGGAR